MFQSMSTSNISDESSCEARDISVEEFWRTEILSSYNPKIDLDLIAISNRDLHCVTVHSEFRKFSEFVTQALHRDVFGNLLLPMFQHFYLFLLGSNGKYDAEQFYGKYSYLFSSSDRLHELLQCETYEDAQNLLKSPSRIRVKLSKRAYTTLLHWLKSNFTRTSEMFNILRVLHENFYIDRYNDKVEEAFFFDEKKIVEKIGSWSDSSLNPTAPKNSEHETKNTAKASSKSKVQIGKTRRTRKKCEPKAGTSKTPTNDSSESDVELDSSMFTLKTSAKAYLDKVINSGKSIEEMAEALLNPPDSFDDDSSENSGEIMDFNKDPGVEHPDDDQRGRHYKVQPKRFQYQETYKTNFHRSFTYTISGKDVVCSSDISPDLLYMAVGFENCKIRTWRFINNNTKSEPIGTLREHEKIVCALSIDSNRKCLISGSHDYTVKIWDIEKSICMKSLELHSAPVWDVCISPNSKYFVSASGDRNICLFWYDELYPIRVYSGHSQQASVRVRFHPNGAYFASASIDGNVFLFKVTVDSYPVRMFHKHKVEVYAVAFSPCGKHLASADVEGILIIWDILNCTPIKIIESGQGIRDMSYDLSGSFIVALFYFQAWKIFNIEGNNNDIIFEVSTHGVPRSFRFAADNTMYIIQHTNDHPKTIFKKGLITAVE